MPFSRRTVLSQFSGAALLASGCAPQAAGPSNHISIATGAGNFNVTMTAVLRQQKFLELFKLEPEILPTADGSKILAGVVSGSIDIVPVSGFAQIFPAVERGADLKIINAATMVPQLALFSSKPGVKTLKDIEGKVVGIGAVGSLIHQLSVTLLKKYQVDVSKVRFLNVGSNTDVFRGVMAGTIDAGCGPASFIPDVDQYKVHLVEHGDMSTELPDFTYQAGWTSGKVIAAKRDLLVRTLAAYVKLFRFVQDPANKDAFLAARKSVFPKSPDQEHLSEWNFLAKAKPLSEDLIISPERIDYMQQINLDFGIQKTKLPYERVFDVSIAKDALKLADATK